MAEKTEGDFNNFLKHLDPDPDAANEIYATLRAKLVTFFSQNDCHPADYHADEVMSRIARMDNLNEIQNIGAYAYGIARNVKFDAWQESKKEIPLDENVIETHISEGPELEDEIIERLDRPREIRCLRRCLGGLTTDKRVMFVRYQMVDERHVEDRKKLAKQFGIPDGRLRTQVCRIRAELECCVRACLAQRKIQPH